MDGKWGKLGESKIYSKPSKSMDQNQQNIIKPTNHKKIGAIFGGEFSKLGKNTTKLG